MGRQKEGAPTAEELINQALAQAAIDSGATSLPAPSEVPEAYSTGGIISNAVANPSQEIIAGGMNSVVAENPHCPPMLRQQALALEQALSVAAPPAPPVQVAFGSHTLIVPASLREAPNRLHTTNATRAQALWNVFVGEDKATMAKLAAQKGYVQKPFVFLAQAIFQLIELESFFPTKGEGTDPFHITEKDPGGAFQKGLVEWAGPDLARVITRTCEMVGVSILGGLKQCYARLEEKRVNELHAAQTRETVDEWSK